MASSVSASASALASVSASVSASASASGYDRGGQGQRRFRGGPREPGAAVDADIDALGRCMTGILRHKALECGLHIGDDGFVLVDELLRVPRRANNGRMLSSYSFEDVEKAVAQDNKQRFSLRQGEDGQWSIRANQGHSISVVQTEALLQPITDPAQFPVCVHGTMRKHMPSIMQQGLHRMGRNHIHFASGLPQRPGGDGPVMGKSGFRVTSQVLIFINMEKAIADGIRFYLSDNGVILSEGQDGVLLPAYFDRICLWPSLQPYV